MIESSEPTKKLQVGKSQELYKRAKEIIPGGTQLLSKRPEMLLPDLWPAYYSKAKGCEIWDLDDNKYVDCAYMGVGANLLGYAYDPVDDAVVDAVRRGVNTTLNAPEEVELTEKLLELHPWADQARYTKTGGEAMAVAVRIARAATNKEKVLFCGYHGWHDWYLSANLEKDQLGQGHLIPELTGSGVPAFLKDSAIPFTYNDTEGFSRLMEEHGGEIACVVLEAVRAVDPTPEFYQTVQKLSAEHGAVFILDEITAGFRHNLGGAHLRYGTVPDMAVFGKAFSNGYPIGAILGKKAIMEAAQGSFISSLFWTERSGFAATLATIRELESQNAFDRIRAVAQQVREGWQRISASTGVNINIGGLPAIQSFGFQNDYPVESKTFFTQEMLRRGYLATVAFYASIAHEGFVEGYLQAVEEVFTELAAILQAGENPATRLEGPLSHTRFNRL